MTAEEFIDLFQRPLYDIQRAYSSVLSNGCHRASSKGPPKMRSAAPLLSLPFPAWSLNVIMGSGSRWLGSCRIWRSASSESALMRSLSSYFCGKRGRLFRGSKHIENAHRVTRPLDHSGLESLRRNIERLIRERRIDLANRLLDRYQLALRSGSFESESALGLQEIQTQVASLSPPAGDADRFSDAHFDLAH